MHKVTGLDNERNAPGQPAGLVGRAVPVRAPAPPPVRPRRGRRGPLGWFAGLFAAGLAVPFDLVLLGAGGAAFVLAAVAAELPPVDALTEVRFKEPLRVYSAEGSLMAEFGVQRRRAVAFSELPPQLIQAFLAAEDSRFYEHTGIDVIGLARAALNLLRTGEPTQGGSTITMQVARNFFLTREKTIQRKLTEILLAWRLEAALSKQEIVSLYLNKIFFGHRAYGVAAAAEFYYQKPLAALTVAQMAMLAGLPKAPSSSNPLSNPERARERRDYVLDRMHALGFIDDTDHLLATTEPLSASAYVAEVEFEADYVAEMARQEMVRRYGEERAYSLGLRVHTTISEPLQRASDEALRRGLRQYDLRHGYHGPEARAVAVAEVDPAAPDTETPDLGALDALIAERPRVPGLSAGVVVRADAEAAEVYLGGSERATLRLDGVRWARPFLSEDRRGRAPRRVTDAVAVGDLIRLRRGDEGDWMLAQVPQVSGAVVALAPEDGAMLALSGGYAFEWSKFNRAVDAERQPGSTFKPFLYAAALEAGYTPASLVKDERFEKPSGSGIWRPQNADGRFMGPIRIRVALQKSRNLAVVHLLNRMGVDPVREAIARFGFPLDSMPADLSMALGSGSVTPLELARGFAAFANGGYRVEPYFITRVEDARGNRLFEAEPRRACMACWIRYPEGEARTAAADGAGGDRRAPRAIDPRVAYNIDSMLKDVIDGGTATRARALERPDVAGKTGTTNEARDSWFAGYQPELLAVVWVGRDDNAPLGRGEWGGTAALGIWIDFMREALDGLPVAEVQIPQGMVPVRISLATGKPTASRRGSRIEHIRDEYQRATLGPDPVQYAPPVAARPRKRTAPRVLDELF